MDDRRGTRNTARALVLPAVLAVAAGFVDAVGFLHLFGVFPANQSGNLVLLGMAVASPVPPPAWVSATSIIGFTAGVAGAARLGRAMPPRRRAPVLLSLELVLLVALAIGNALVEDRDSLLSGVSLGVWLLVAAVAMGVQTESIRRAAGVGVSTTYETGAMARIGETLGPDPASQQRQGTTTFIVLGAMVTCYVTGAALGAGPLGEGRGGLVLPGLAVALVLVAVLAGHDSET